MAGSFIQNLTTSGVQGIITEAAKVAVNYTAESFDLSNLKTSYQKFITLLERLQAILEDHHKMVQSNQDKTTTTRFNVWCNHVRKMINQKKKLDEQYHDIGELSKFLCRPDCAETIRNMVEEAEKLLSEENKLGDFLIDKPLEPIVKLKTPDISAFPTLHRGLLKVLSCLNDKKVKRIAICGSLGVGKTTILQNLNNQDDVSRTFELVMFIQVSQVTREEELQKKIMARLKMTDILHVLEEKKYLLILDDVEFPFNLERIGVIDNNKGSKVIISTKSKHVVARMDVDRLVNLQTVSKDESWNMFQDIVGDIIDSSDIEPIARQVAQECGGIPLLIKKVANYFKLKYTDSEWRIELDKLRRCPEERIPGFNEIHAFIKLCYDSLESEEQKHCFLYGALFPPCSKILTDILVECWASEGFLGSIDEKNGFHGIRDQGNVILRHLLNISLLESDEKVMYVNLTAVVQHVALRISFDILGSKFLHDASTDACYEIWISSNCDEAKRISVGSKLTTLPETPNCKKLLSLLLQGNLDLKVIPLSFFDKMEKLLVLNLQDTGITSLPSSVEKATEMKGLYLNGCCNLTELPPELGKLEDLLVLDIRDSKVPFIYKKLERLEHLRCLRLSYHSCNNLDADEAIEINAEDGVLSKLSRLEELTIEVSACDDQWLRDLEKIMKQLAALEKLTTLNLGFLTPTVIGSQEYNEIWNRLKSCWLFVGCKHEEHPQFLDNFDQQIRRYLRYDALARDATSPTICPSVLSKIQVIELIHHIHSESFTDLLSMSNLNDLVGCLIDGCSNMKTIIDGTKLPVGVVLVLQRLQQLHLKNLAELQGIFHGTIPGKSLGKLHTIVVTSCPVLASIGTFDHTILRKLVIKDCDGIQEVVMPQSIEVLEVHNLPKLATLSAYGSSSYFPNLHKLEVSRCYELKSLPFNGSNVPTLKSIAGEQEWWDRLQMEEDQVKELLQSIFRSIR